MSQEHKMILGTTTLDRLLVSGAESGLNQHQIAYKLLELGVFRFDTAQSYGQGQQEDNLGRMLAKTKRDQYEVITKIMPSEMKSRGSFFDAIYLSLKRLNVDYLDSLLIHWPTKKGEFRGEFMEEALKIGLTRRIGLSNFDNADAKVFIGNPNWSDFTEALHLSHTKNSLQIYNECKVKEKNFLGYSVLNGGTLSNRKVGRETLTKVSLQLGVSEKQLALMVIRESFPHASLIFSSSKLEHIQEICSTPNVKLSEEIKREILSNCASTIRKVQCSLIEVKPDELHASRFGHRVPTNIWEAQENIGGASPSPSDLAEEFKVRRRLTRPIKIRKTRLRKRDVEYEIVNSRIVFWGWVLAFGMESEIEAEIIE